MEKNEKKLLKPDGRIGILNRGEAAYRFIRSLKEYNNLYSVNLKSVSFYIEKEEQSLFAKSSDESYLLSGMSGISGSPGKAIMPYLDHDLLIDALKKTSCSAVWAGWGFLSEDSEFAGKIEKSGIVFLGPSGEAMALLGDKISAKALAEKSDVPVLPWSMRPLAGIDDACQFAEKLGYPVIIKASNAGGGRGIRIVRSKHEMEAMYKSAREETLRITGNDLLFMECFVEKGRHLEVQVLADTHGNINTFGVRDCSIQRRNQKIIEETPPALLDKEILISMEEASSRLIKAASYTGAGTVEYLYDLNRNQFYFMEVNTRLQVEHPITEILYGIDLVKGQIDVAMGKKVDLKGSTPKGAIMEVRINAEDPASGFSPAPGDVLLFKAPAGPGIRVDSGIERNSSIPSEFDSMIAKIIASGSDRQEAIARMKRALQEFRIKIRNGTTNKAFVLSLLDNPEIQKGGTHTGFVEELINRKGTSVPDDKVAASLVSCAIELYIRQHNADFLNFRSQVSRSGKPGRIPSMEGIDVNLSSQGCSYSFHVKNLSGGLYHISFKDNEIACRYSVSDFESELVLNGTRYSLIVTERGDAFLCEVDGWVINVEAQSQGYIKSMSPAIVLSAAVSPGTIVKKGQPVIILEAMKMEMVINAPSDGVIAEVYVSDGMQVSAGQSLVRIEPAGASGSGEAGTGEKEELQPVSFSVISESDESASQKLKDMVLAHFLGYDSGPDVLSMYRKLASDAFDSGKYPLEFMEFILSLIRIYIAVEKLFLNKKIASSLFSRPLTYPEMLSHFFLRTEDRKKGLPDEFLKDIDEALKFFIFDDTSGNDYTGGYENNKMDLALYYLFRSHKNIHSKEEILKSVFLDFENVKIGEKHSEVLEQISDEVISISAGSNPILLNAVVRLKYLITDILKPDLFKEEHSEYSESLISGVDISDTGPEIMNSLIKLCLSPDENIRKTGLKHIGRRFNRDRDISSSFFCNNQVSDIFCAEGKYGTSDIISCISFFRESEFFRFSAAGESAAFLPVPGTVKLPDKADSEKELIILVYNDKKKDPDQIFDYLISMENLPPEYKITIGICSESEEINYRSFNFENNKWKEENNRRGFSPLQYRELKVYRFINFILKVIYRNKGVLLCEARSKENPEDIRLAAFIDVSEKTVNTADNGKNIKLDLFEALLIDAVNAMRSVLPAYRERLLWNRIVIHNRPLLGIGLKKMEEYGRTLIALTDGIGLEKLVILTRRKRWSEKSARPLELDISSITDKQLVIRSRIPAEKPLITVDSYARNVILARRRNVLYPYEITKMLTGSSFYGGSVPQGGKFEEYDIEIDNAEKTHSTISVKNRKPGLNEANIIFGIIENSDLKYSCVYRRVIILSDPLKDMGSLSEGECRRVIASLDLAEKEKIPVEWLPVSSGARIDMESGTENLDWTAAVLKRIIEFTQNGGEINIIVSSINVGAQSYWNAEATMLMHTCGLLIMTDDASMLLTGKKALDFSGSVSGDNNLDIGGVEKIMGPNGQAQFRVSNIAEAYNILFRHYRLTYLLPSESERYSGFRKTEDPSGRDISVNTYIDNYGQGFETIGDIFSIEKNPERKKPFDIRQIMNAVKDGDSDYLERWQLMADSDTSVIWETRIGGYSAGMIGIESRTIPRIGEIPYDGPESWSGGTLYPLSSKKTARALNAFSGRLPVVILANLSGFDGSPESLRKLQLEYGAEIGRAVVNFKGPLIFVVVARYHGGAYVVFSKALNPNLTAAAVKGSYASVIGGIPAAAVVFPKKVYKETCSDERIVKFQSAFKNDRRLQSEYDDLFKKVYNEKQNALGHSFDAVHSVERAKQVGSIDDIIEASDLRPYIINMLEKNTGMDRKLRGR
ncbi:MAG: biotin/lipoyl-binding protein [Spirochaetales bacterium]|nr:biotin/lipoyl-binding protein [Spirochaetales bacterium]